MQLNPITNFKCRTLLTKLKLGVIFVLEMSFFKSSCVKSLRVVDVFYNVKDIFSVNNSMWD